MGGRIGTCKRRCLSRTLPYKHAYMGIIHGDNRKYRHAIDVLLRLRVFSRACVGVRVCTIATSAAPDLSTRPINLSIETHAMAYARMIVRERVRIRRGFNSAPNFLRNGQYVHTHIHGYLYMYTYMYVSKYL